MYWLQRWRIKKRGYSEKNKSSVFMDKKTTWWLVSWIENYLLINKTFGKFFILHSTLSFKKKLIKSFPSFYKEILVNWKIFFCRIRETPSCILSQLLFYNIYIQIDEGDGHLSRFSQNNLNLVSQLFDTNGTVKSWHLLK